MNHLRLHVPRSVDTDRAVEFDFETTEQLLANPWIARAAEEYDGRRFHRFSISDRDTNPTLMLECDEGRWWWVLGYLRTGMGVDLPDWVPVREPVPSTSEQERV